jgi:hypothetical protein
MKKILLAFSMIGMMILMNSCLDSGEQTYTGNSEFAYVTRDNNGLIYARTGSFNMITAPELQLLTPENCYFISYSWSSSNGITQSSDNFKLMNVSILGNPAEDRIPSTSLIMNEAPEELTTPVTIYFPPAYHSSNFFGDFWAFSYRWKKKEGESATLQFYKANSSGNESGSSDEVLIDIRLIKTGSGIGTEKTQDDVIAVNLSQLRYLLGPLTGTTTKNVPIRFRYYEEGKTTPTTTTTSYFMAVYVN